MTKTILLKTKHQTTKRNDRKIRKMNDAEHIRLDGSSISFFLSASLSLSLRPPLSQSLTHIHIRHNGFSLCILFMCSISCCLFCLYTEGKHHIKLIECCTFVVVVVVVAIIVDNRGKMRIHNKKM